MSSFSRSLANILFGWVSGVISQFWDMINTDSGTALIPWIGKLWLWVVIILCLLGLAIDLIVYAIRWRPHKVWISAFNRIRNKRHPSTELQANGNKTTGSTNRYERETEQTQFAGVRLDTDGYSMGEETIRYVPDRVRRKSANPAETAIPGEYEQMYARPEGERSVRGGNNTRTTDYIAPRRKHSTRSDDEDDEDLLLDYRRSRRTAARIDPADAYKAPVYPPQWNLKSNSGETKDNE